MSAADYFVAVVMAALALVEVGLFVELRRSWRREDELLRRLRRRRPNHKQDDWTSIDWRTPTTGELALVRDAPLEDDTVVLVRWGDVT